MTGLAIAALVVLAVIPAYLAGRKRRTRKTEIFVTYYLFGLLLLVAAIPAAIWVAKDERLQDDRADVLERAAFRD